MTKTLSELAADAREALDSMDDFARMETGVDAHGPRGVLERFIADSEALARRVEVASLVDISAGHEGQCFASPADESSVEAMLCLNGKQARLVPVEGGA